MTAPLTTIGAIDIPPSLKLQRTVIAGTASASSVPSRWVNAVSPGIIKSPMHPVATHAQLDALHPVGHMGEMSDIVDAVLYLEGASFVTGEILHVDGGQSAGH